MFEWAVAIVTSVVGAGAGSMFNKILSRPPRFRNIKEPPPESLAGVIRSVAGIQEWQAKAEEMFRIQDRELRRLKKGIRAFRMIVDAFLLLLLCSLLAWFYVTQKR